MTPLVTDFTLQVLSPSLTACVLPHRNEWNHDNRGSRIPMALSLDMRRLCGTQSKALLMWKYMTRTECPLSLHVVTYSVSSKRHVAHDLDFIKPCLFGFRI